MPIGAACNTVNFLELTGTNAVFCDLYTLYKNNSAKVIYAVDKDKNIHGALFIIWDDNSSYNLI